MCVHKYLIEVAIHKITRTQCNPERKETATKGARGIDVLLQNKPQCSDLVWSFTYEHIRIKQIRI